MVLPQRHQSLICNHLSVLALSSRFDGLELGEGVMAAAELSVLALSSRFDGHSIATNVRTLLRAFSTRSVESF